MRLAFLKVDDQIIRELLTKYGKYAKRYTSDNELFSTKFSTKSHFKSQSSHYGAFYLEPDFKTVKPQPCLNYHSSKSQILGHKRLEQIKLKQELG